MLLLDISKLILFNIVELDNFVGVGCKKVRSTCFYKHEWIVKGMTVVVCHAWWSCQSLVL